MDDPCESREGHKKVAPESSPTAAKSLGKRLRKYTVRTVQIVLAVTAIYLLVILVGLIPINNDFREDENGIEIFVFAGSFHAEFILPIENEVMDWRPWFAETQTRKPADRATHVAFGWGDRSFFIETPTWDEFRWSTGFKALFWSSASCMHVTFYDHPDFGEPTRSVRISAEQYRGLVDHILGSFELSGTNRFQQLPQAAYGDLDAFFVSKGTYHILNTCNSWVGRGLKRARVRTGWYTPLPRTFQWYLPQ